MVRLHPTAIVLSLICLAVAARPASAQQPPDSVASDANQNTAMGSDALLNLVGSGCAAFTACWGNTAAGAGALEANTTGYYNTALGIRALAANTTGALNTAVGAWALLDSTTGSFNTAVGMLALETDTTGGVNTAVGYGSMSLNTTGTNNAAFGVFALGANTTGTYNVAVGNGTMGQNTTGTNDTAIGYGALNANTTGPNNTAFGYLALLSNTTGKGNAAQGANALYSNTTGIRNLGIGSNALYSNVTGSYNIALGFDAGYNSTGNDNIYINNQGVAGDSQTLRLGTAGTAGVAGSGILSAYIAGVATTQVTGAAVYITPSGQLGVLASSERFKTQVETMGSASERLAQLRPVTFKLKSDRSGATQYGLIAEEVAKVYPELVIRGADGRIDGVRYEELAPMLLNETQQLRQVVEQQAKEIAALKAERAEIREIKRQLADLRDR